MRRQPLDRTPSPDGTVAVYRDGTGTRRARTVTEAEPVLGYERLHTPHPATCPARVGAAVAAGR